MRCVLCKFLVAVEKKFGENNDQEKATQIFPKSQYDFEHGC